MPVRSTTQLGHPNLRGENKGITDFADPQLKQLVADLVDSMHAANLIGMAAPQIGENYLVFVTEPRETATRSKDQTDELRVYINPKIVNFSEEKVIIYEGCGSVSHGQLFGPVERPSVVTVEAQDLTGKKFQFTADGILGRVIQHECDHLQGKIFLEQMRDFQALMSVEYYVKKIKNNPDFTQAVLITKKELIYN